MTINLFLSHPLQYLNSQWGEITINPFSYCGYYSPSKVTTYSINETMCHLYLTNKTPLQTMMLDRLKVVSVIIKTWEKVLTMRVTVFMKIKIVKTSMCFAVCGISALKSWAYLSSCNPASVWAYLPCSSCKQRDSKDNFN